MKITSAKSQEAKTIFHKCCDSICEILFIYEPLIKSDYYQNFKLVHDLDEFKSQVDLIITNRTDNKLNDVHSKIYTRDVFNID